MKKINLLLIIFFIISCSDSSSVSTSKGDGSESVDPINQAILTVGSKADLESTYSFYYKSVTALSVTGNRWDLLALDDSTDIFQVNLSAFDKASIVDLGLKTCASVAISSDQKIDFSEDLIGGFVESAHRLTAPNYWIGFTDAMRSLQLSPSTSATISLNHCYIMTNTTADYMVTALFSVSKVESVGSEIQVILDEIELFNKKSLK